MPFKSMHVEAYKTFTEAEHSTWQLLFDNLAENRRTTAHPIFVDGVKALNLTRERIPDIHKVNEILQSLTGWKGVPVTGLEDGLSFYPALARREFPIGNFIRDRETLGYTPAPDVFHDLYGHLPFFANEAYAKFCEEYGIMATKYINDPQKLKRVERFFWFALEFTICEHPTGRKIFGAGIISSRDECLYSLSNKPEVRTFNISSICAQDYNIDVMQPIIYLLKSPEQLYESLQEVERVISA